MTRNNFLLLSLPAALPQLLLLLALYEHQSVAFAFHRAVVPVVARASLSCKTAYSPFGRPDGFPACRILMMSAVSDNKDMERDSLESFIKANKTSILIELKKSALQSSTKNLCRTVINDASTLDEQLVTFKNSHGTQTLPAHPGAKSVGASNEEKSSKPVDVDEFMRQVLEFYLDKVVESDKGNWWKSVQLVSSFTDEACGLILYSGIMLSLEEMIGSLNQIQQQQQVSSVRVSFMDYEKNKKILKDFETFDEASLKKAVSKPNVKKLEAFLEEQVIPLKMKGSAGLAMPMSPNLAFVDQVPERHVAEDYFEDAVQADKDYAIVVAGESGSGKSVYSCLQSKMNGYTVVYLTVTGEKDKNQDGKNKKDEDKDKPVFTFTDTFPKLNDFLRRIICIIEGDESMETALMVLYSEKSKLNLNRNENAVKLFDELFRRKIGGAYVGWLEGDWVNRPEKVAIVIDEATDVNLAEGLLETIREQLAKYRGKLVPESGALKIIIAGTGLDVIRFPGRVGTNPKYSRLVTMKSPCITELEKQGQITAEVASALNRGTYSRIFKSNARMLFQAVLPILTMGIHRRDNIADLVEKSRRLEERLCNIGSFRELMDFGPRLFLASNSVGDMEDKIRSNLFEDAFVYHMVESIRKEKEDRESDSARLILENHLKMIETIDAYNRLDKSDIFKTGLASKSGTSRALKFLACFGLTCLLRPGFGDVFEEMTALHFMRLMEVRGYETQRIALTYSWPPQSTVSDGKLTEDEIKSATTYYSDDQTETELDSIHWDSLPGKGCIIFTQGTATAQGADLFVFYWENNVAKMYAVQCKSMTKYDRANFIKKGWWSALGIVGNDFYPKDGSAGYSYAGLEKFCSMLEGKSGKTVQIEKRIHATSASAPPSAYVAVPKSGENDQECAEIWFREMFEPTISVVAFKLPGEVLDVDGRYVDDSSGDDSSAAE